MSAQAEITADWMALARQANYSTAELARLRDISVRQLEREFRRTMGQPPEKWLNDLRLADALALLQEGDSVKVVATSLGYKHSQSFSRAFKQIYGVSPSAVGHIGASN